MARILFYIHQYSIVIELNKNLTALLNQIKCTYQLTQCHLTKEYIFRFVTNSNILILKVHSWVFCKKITMDKIYFLHIKENPHFNIKYIV